MLINQIRLSGLHTIDLRTFGALPSDPFIFKSADGLGPPEFNVTIANQRYLRRTPVDREIVIRVGLNPNFADGQTAETLRSRIYGLLGSGPSDIISVQLMYGDLVQLVASGVVKRIVPVQFAKEPEVQITISCLKSYLERPEVTIVDPGEFNKFEFGIENEIESAVTPMYFEIVFTEGNVAWEIRRHLTDLKMSFVYDFASGDKLMVQTAEGNRSVKILRDEEEINIIHALTPDSTWLDLRGGPNLFETTHDRFNWGFVRFTPIYWGV